VAAFSGYCKLVVDDRPVGWFCVSIDLQGREARAFGFLSAPPELLERAKGAKGTRIKLADGQAFNISILHITKVGVALIEADGSANKITVQFSRANRTELVEADGVRIACISAEAVLRNAKEPVAMTVRGGLPGMADHVRQYLSAVQDELIAEQRLTEKQAEIARPPAARHQFAQQSDEGRSREAGRPTAHNLEKLGRNIVAAKLLIEKQSTILAGLRARGADVRLAESVLVNLKESLALLIRHRNVMSQLEMAAGES
jgi:hypothetical protein